MGATRGMHGPLGAPAQVRFELVERLIDRGKFGAVGRQEEQLGASPFYGVARGERLVTRIVVLMTMSQGESLPPPRRTWETKTARLIGPSSNIGATVLVQRRPAMRLVAFQCP